MLLLEISVYISLINRQAAACDSPNPCPLMYENVNQRWKIACVHILNQRRVLLTGSLMRLGTRQTVKSMMQLYRRAVGRSSSKSLHKYVNDRPRLYHTIPLTDPSKRFWQCLPINPSRLLLSRSCPRRILPFMWVEILERHNAKMTDKLRWIFQRRGKIALLTQSHSNQTVYDYI